MFFCFNLLCVKAECYVVRPDNSEDQRRLGARGSMCLLHVSTGGVTLAVQASIKCGLCIKFSMILITEVTRTHVLLSRLKKSHKIFLLNVLLLEKGPESFSLLSSVVILIIS